MPYPIHHSRATAKTFALTSIISAAIILAGCQTTRPAATVIGGAIGAAAGSKVGGGRGKTFAMIMGGLAGAIAGSAIGQRLDEHAQMKANEATATALESARPGEGIRWDATSAETGQQNGIVHINRRGQDASGHRCAEYIHTVTIRGETEKVVGTACKGADGAWHDTPS